MEADAELKFSAPQYETTVTNFKWVWDNFGRIRYHQTYPQLSDAIVETDQIKMHLELSKPDKEWQWCRIRETHKTPPAAAIPEVVVKDVKWSYQVNDSEGTNSIATVLTNKLEGVWTSMFYERFKPHYYPNEIMTINVEITWGRVIFPSQYVAQIGVPKSNFTPELFQPFKSGKLADFEIVSSDAQVFSTQKVVLAMRIPNFFAVFFDSFDRNDSRIEVVFDSDTAAALLEFVYADEIVNLPPVASRLVQLAHMYKMDRLVALCLVEIAKHLHLDNVSEALSIAELYGIQPLKDACDHLLKERQLE